MPQTKFRVLVLVFVGLSPGHGLAAEPAAEAINHLGLRLLRVANEENVLLSPYSIHSILAMTYAGAEGKTRKQMGKMLRFPASE